MPIVMISNLVPGMKLSKDVTKKNGIKLLSKGTILSSYIIEYLYEWKINSVHIEEDEIETINIRKEKQEKSSKAYSNTLNKVEECIEGLKGSNSLKLEYIRETITEIEDFTEISSMLQTINNIKDKDKYMYQHSINVAIYSSFIGRWLGLDESTLKKLIYSALLHDIGKTRITKEILKKPGRLNDQEYKKIKEHPVYGYNIIKKNKYLSHSIALGVLQHHERENGSGYPLGVTGEKIHIFGKIIAVADIYDAMTSNRVYKARESALKVIEEMLSDSFHTLDPKIVRVFVNGLTDFYIGSTVILNNGDVGEIITINPSYPTKPLVKSNNNFIDLRKEKDIEIQDILIS